MAVPGFGMQQAVLARTFILGLTLVIGALIAQDRGGTVGYGARRGSRRQRRILSGVPAKATSRP